MIIENPYSTQHYLLRYSPLKPSLIDEDRRIRGDYYKKPTMYFFVNCEPSYNFIWGEYSTQEQYLNVASGSIDGLGCKDRRHARSMISPKYANRFIREFVLEGEKREEGFLI